MCVLDTQSKQIKTSKHLKLSSWRLTWFLLQLQTHVKGTHTAYRRRMHSNNISQQPPLSSEPLGERPMNRYNYNPPALADGSFDLFDTS